MFALLSASKRQTSTRVAWLENRATLTPCLVQVAPSGLGAPVLMVNSAGPSNRRPHRPDTVRVLANASIAGKVTHVQAIDDCLLAPFDLQTSHRIHLILRLCLR